MKHEVVLLEATSTASLAQLTKDGRWENVHLAAGDTVALSGPPVRGFADNCQRCGHLHGRHGIWIPSEDDPCDEEWDERPCQDLCGCEGWVDFTPWFEGHP